MMFTDSELEEVELMKLYCNDDILIHKVLLQVFSNDFHNSLVKRLGLVLFPHNIPVPEGDAVPGVKVTQLVNGRRN